MGDFTAFEVLAHRFTCTWGWPEARTESRLVLGAFERAPALDTNLPMSNYAFVDGGESAEGFRYRLCYDAQELWSANHPHEVLAHFFWHVNREAFAKTEFALLVHAGVVAPAGRPAILLPAPSGSGKTTLVTALLASGRFEFLSDEAAPIDPATLEVAPFPKALAIKGNLESILPDVDAARSLPAGTWHWYLDPAEIPAPVSAGPRRIGAVVFPTYVKGAALDFAAIGRADAAAAMLADILNPALWPAGGLAVLADVVRGTRTFRLSYGDVREAVEVIERLAV